MTAALSAQPRPARPRNVLLRGVPWALYDALVCATGAQHVRMTYDRGELEIMPPLPEHEWWKTILATLVMELTSELRVRYVPFGSTTWRRQDLGRGIEADDCHYVQNAARIAGRRVLDLAVDPPPDLAIEIDITHREVAREGVYAALGIPEVWRFDGRTLDFLVLEADAYRRAESSRAFPALRRQDLERFLLDAETTDLLDLRDRFRAWVRQTLAGDPSLRSG